MAQTHARHAFSHLHHGSSLQGLPERRFEALDGEVQRLDGRLPPALIRCSSLAFGLSEEGLGSPDEGEIDFGMTFTP